MSTFIFKGRDFSDIILPSLTYQVNSYSQNAIGGPKDATIVATGSREAIFELIEHLRAPVEIFDDTHEAVWWGYIHSVQISWHGIEYGVSLDSMDNKVAVAYTEKQFRSTTDYNSDATSVAEYGTKENLLSRSEITDADALQLRETWLTANKYPGATIRTVSGAGARAERAVIVCKGWLYTLDWRYYTNNEGLEAYETIGKVNSGREIGEDGRPIFAQAFQLSSSSGWTATHIWIRLWKSGSPSDNFQLALKSNSGGNPGTTLASATLAGASVTNQATWTEFELSSSVALSTGTTYWIHCSRAGAVDADNYFIIGVNLDKGYLNGDAKYYKTSAAAWIDASHKGDMNFRVMGNTETTAQISTLVTTYGEFFTAVQIVDSSGVSTNAYRNGDRTALYDLLKLLNTGTTNDLRLLCEVTRGRVMKVYEEPARPTVTTDAYSLSGSGALYTPQGGLVRPSDCKVGVWANLGDVVPATVDKSRISDPSVFFIEESQYYPMEDYYRVVRTRDERDVLQIGGVI